MEIATPEAGTIQYREYRAGARGEYLYREATREGGRYTKFTIYRPDGSTQCAFDMSGAVGAAYDEYALAPDTATGNQVGSVRIVVKEGVLSLITPSSAIIDNRLVYFLGRASAGTIDVRYDHGKRAVVMLRRFDTGASSEYFYLSRYRTAGYSMGIYEDGADTIKLPAGAVLMWNNRPLDPANDYYEAFKPYLEGLLQPTGYFTEWQDSLVTKWGRFDSKGEVYWMREYAPDGKVVAEVNPKGIDIDKAESKDAIPATRPRFMGGSEEDFGRWVLLKVKNPKLRAQLMNDMVVVDVALGKDGYVDAARVTYAPGKRVAEKILAIIVRSPRWSPATRGGKDIPAIISMSLTAGSVTR